MLKIKELFKEFIETQKNINTSIKELREDLKPQMSTWATTTIKIDKLENCFETNVYTKEQTVEAINKEIDYKNELNEIKKKYPEMLEFIELISTNYANMDKYMILDTTKMLSSEYEIKRRK